MPGRAVIDRDQHPFDIRNKPLRLESLAFEPRLLVGAQWHARQ